LLKQKWENPIIKRLTANGKHIKIYNGAGNVWEVDDQIRKKFKPPDVVSTFVWVVSLFEMFTWLWRLAKGVAELLSKLLLCCWPTDVAVLTSGIGGGNSTSTSSSSFVPVREGNWRQPKSITATTTATTTTTPCAVKLLSSQHNTDLKLVPWRETSSWRAWWDHRQLFPVLDPIRLSWWIRRSLYCPSLRLSWPAAANEKSTKNTHT
jgi:hypothetical protein